MAVEIKISLDAKQLSKALLDLGRNGTRNAANQAINRTLTGVRTDATRYLAEKSNVKRSGPVRKKFILKKSTRQTLRAELVTPPMNLGLANQKGTRVVGRKGNKRIKWRGRITEAFQIKGRVGGLQNDYFVRVPGRRSPMRAYAFTLLQSYHHHKTGAHLREKAQARLDKNFATALKNQLRRAGLS